MLAASDQERAGSGVSEDFVGRTGELAGLTEAVEEAAAGRGRVVMLAGEPGAGKTRLAQELAGLATARGVHVVWGRSSEHAGAPAYWPWIQVVRGCLKTISRTPGDEWNIAEPLVTLVPEARALPPAAAAAPHLGALESTRFQLLDAVRAFLQRMAATGPLMAILDDLQWADSASLDCLEFLATEAAASRLLVVGTFRDVDIGRRHPLQRTLAELSRDRRFVRLSLSALSRDEVRGFVRQRLPDASPALVRHVHRLTNGNPFYLTEVVQLLSQELTPAQRRAARLPAVRIPEGVRAVVGRRLDALPDETQALLIDAAVLGPTCDVAKLAAMRGESTARVLELLEPVVSAGVLRPEAAEAGRFEFPHDLVRESVLADLTTTQRVHLHARAARALEEFYNPDAAEHARELAHHFDQAQLLLGAEKLLTYTRLAADQELSRYAYVEAERHYRRALEARGNKQRDRLQAELVAGLAHALEGQGQPESNQRLQQAIVLMAELRLPDLAIQFEERSAFGVGCDFPTLTVRELIAQAREDGLDHTLLQCRLAIEAGFSGTDRREARRQLAQARAVAAQSGDSHLSLMVLTAAGLFGDTFGFKLSERDGRALTDLAEASPDPRLRQRARYVHARWLLECARVLEAAETASACLQDGEQCHEVRRIETGLGVCLGAALAQGDWKRIAQVEQRGSHLALPGKPVEIPGRRAPTTADSTWTRQSSVAVRLAQAAAYTGHREEAMRHLAGFIDELQSRQARGPMAAAVAAIHYQLGGIDAAVLAAALEVVRATLAQSDVGRIDWVGSYHALALLGLATANAELLQEAAVQLAGCPRPLPNLFCLVPVPRILGLAADARGDLEAARRAFQQATELCRERGCQPEFAWSCYDYAQCLLRLGDTQDAGTARVLLDQAAAVARRLGMRPLLERVSRLRQPGHERRDGLTPRELEVLALVCRGYTDRDIGRLLSMAHRTASNHVRSILAKTGTANRTEAATCAERTGLVGQDESEDTHPPPAASSA